MIYTCRFCEWKSIYPNKLMQHIEDNHELILKIIKVKENGNELAILNEELVKDKICHCDESGFLNTFGLITPNKCRFCGTRFKSYDKYQQHVQKDHGDNEVEIEIRVCGDGFAVTIEELARKKISVK